MIDLHRMPSHKQLIQLRLYISLVFQHLLEHTLAISPDSNLSATEVLDALHGHFQGLRSKALCCRELLSCKQADGESFADYYARLKDLTAEVELCTGDPATCTEIQLKMILLMGVRDKELL